MGWLIGGHYFMRNKLFAGIAALLLTAMAVIPILYAQHQRNALRLGRNVTPAAEPEPVAHAAEKNVFRSPLAGAWYPGDKEALTRMLDAFAAKAEVQPVDSVQALIMPHAGYEYSGAVAAYGMKALAGKSYKRVVVMGPSHRVPIDGVGVTEVSHYATPLGEIPIDQEFIAKLRQYPQFRSVPQLDQAEHSVQIELPLLQRAIPQFTLVPLVFGDMEDEDIRQTARILQGLIDSETLVIASSDFTHYGARYGYVPFSDNVDANLEKLDMGAWQCIEKKDGGAFADYIGKTGATICGRVPIRVLLAMLPLDSAPRLLKYDTSARITGQTDMSVSYLSIAFSGKWPQPAPAVAPPTPAAAATLSDDDKAQLLKLARAVLEQYVKTGKTPRPEDIGITITPGMSQIMGAFVTLKINGELRGCIGEIAPRRPLYKAVIDHAVDAAVNDPRFSPVTENELPLLEYEISALTPPSPVGSYKDIVIGKHGMTIEKQGRMAVFLPQVAPEQGWDLSTTLMHLSRKAGLAADAWKDGATFTVFEAIVFHGRK
jgi:AmmeMemoRadiSam system protein B/AmmeMemoRadiSam system protein A